MCTPQSSEEDLQKLESLICEHLELKGNNHFCASDIIPTIIDSMSIFLIDNLEKTNIAMRQHFSLISQWHNNVIQLKAEKATEIQQLKDANDEVIE